ncbi:helix-turn-helix transcriptional regulator [Nocardia mangyaensis]|uniref:helix-turn-helix transcriptional regulator n=1 Tax=Nocardia mangyaensis TaxID=2213200 RepID=UPI000A458E41|nr:WYL domain-containing protein [Nocardia mangyaensis]
MRVAAVSGAADAEASLRALATVRQVLPSRLRHRIDGATFTTLPADAAVAADSGVLMDVNAAVRAREVLRFDYVSVGRDPDETPSQRRVEPHHVVFGNGRWYLAAWDLDVDDWRIYRLDRLTPRTPTGPRFTPRTVPGGDVSDFLAARFKGSDRGSTWPCTGEVVVVLPAREVIPFVPEGIVEELEDIRCRIVVGSWSWVALAASIGRFDATITDVRPRELADACALLARRFADIGRIDSL